MGNYENSFKTVSVGGFNKKEVAGFIENMEREYKSKLATLEKIVAVTQSARGELEQRMNLLANDGGKIRSENEQMKVMIAGLQDQLQVKGLELQRALEEIEVLQSSHGETSLMETKLYQATRQIEELQIREAELVKLLDEQSANVSVALQEKIDALQAELAAQQALIERLQQENEQLRQEVEQNSASESVASVSTELLLELQTQMERRNRQIIQMDKELEIMRDRCRNYEQTVSALEDVQAKANLIEEEARAKAGEIISVATQESGKMKQELDKWLSDIEVSYKKIKQDAEAKVSYAYAELEKTKAAMDQIAEEQDEFTDRKPFSVINSARVGDTKKSLLG